MFFISLGLLFYLAFQSNQKKVHTKSTDFKAEDSPRSCLEMPDFHQGPKENKYTRQNQGQEQLQISI